MSLPTAMSFHHLKKLLGYLKETVDCCLVHKQEEVTSRREEASRREKAIGTWRHSQTQTQAESKATESQRQEDSMR